MQIGQLRTLIQSFAEFGCTAGNHGAFAHLRDFAGVFPAGSETTTKFIARLKKGLSGRDTFDCPHALWVQLKGIEACLLAAGAKSSGDLSALLEVLTVSKSIATREFIQSIIVARDFEAAPKPPKTPRKPKEKKPKASEIVSYYIDSLNRTAKLSGGAFGELFESLKTDARLSDASVKKIAKTLWGRAAKSRAEAFEYIQAFRNREALTSSSLKALDLSPI